jgi:hypothetical protein
MEGLRLHFGYSFVQKLRFYTKRGRSAETYFFQGLTNEQNTASIKHFPLLQRNWIQVVLLPNVRNTWRLCSLTISQLLRVGQK